MRMPSSRTQLLISLGLAGIGLALLLFSRNLDTTALLKPAALLFLLGALGATLHTIRTRREPVSHDDGQITAAITGAQAVLSGLSRLVLVLAVLVAVTAWILDLGDALLAWSKENSGVYPLLAGLFLLLHGLGPVLGKAVSMRGYVPVSKADATSILVITIVEKTVSLLLALVGLALAVFGLAALATGRGALEMALAWL